MGVGKLETSKVGVSGKIDAVVFGVVGERARSGVGRGSRLCPARRLCASAFEVASAIASCSVLALAFLVDVQMGDL